MHWVLLFLTKHILCLTQSQEIVTCIYVSFAGNLELYSILFLLSPMPYFELKSYQTYLSHLSMLWLGSGARISVTQFVVFTNQWPFNCLLISHGSHIVQVHFTNMLHILRMASSDSQQLLCFLNESSNNKKALTRYLIFRNVCRIAFLAMSYTVLAQRTSSQKAKN